MSHTPGPWETEWPKFDCTIKSRGGVVATVYIGQELGDSESEANANLIAASPDLLAALKNIVRGYDGPTVDAATALSSYIDGARAAIAKAEGK